MNELPKQALRRDSFLMKRQTRRLKRIAFTLLALNLLGFASLRLLQDYLQFIF